MHIIAFKHALVHLKYFMSIRAAKGMYLAFKLCICDKSRNTWFCVHCHVNALNYCFSVDEHRTNNYRYDSYKTNRTQLCAYFVGYTVYIIGFSSSNWHSVLRPGLASSDPHVLYTTWNTRAFIHCKKSQDLARFREVYQPIKFQSDMKVLLAISQRRDLMFATLWIKALQ